MSETRTQRLIEAGNAARLLRADLDAAECREVEAFFAWRGKADADGSLFRAWEQASAISVMVRRQAENARALLLKVALENDDA